MSNRIGLELLEEGDFWNAYLVDERRTQPPAFLGSLHMSLAAQKPLQERFVALMQAAVKHLVAQTGAQPIGFLAPVAVAANQRGSA